MGKTADAVAGAGGERAVLEALRDRYAAALDDPETASGNLKQLGQALLDVIERIGKLDVEEGADDLGLAARLPDDPIDPAAF